MLQDAKIIAELLGIKNPIFKNSPYSGIEILWEENPQDIKLRFITFVGDFCYTKNPMGLNENWISQLSDWMLYLK